MKNDFRRGYINGLKEALRVIKENTDDLDPNRTEYFEEGEVAKLVARIPQVAHPSTWERSQDCSHGEGCVDEITLLKVKDFWEVGKNTISLNDEDLSFAEIVFKDGRAVYLEARFAIDTKYEEHIVAALQPDVNEDNL